MIYANCIKGFIFFFMLMRHMFFKSKFLKTFHSKWYPPSHMKSMRSMMTSKETSSSSSFTFFEFFFKIFFLVLITRIFFFFFFFKISSKHMRSKSFWFIFSMKSPEFIKFWNFFFFLSCIIIYEYF